jgi:hypothetical protein
VTHRLCENLINLQAITEIPNDFLRLSPLNVQESVDREAALALQQQMAFNPIGLAVSDLKVFC